MNSTSAPVYQPTAPAVVPSMPASYPAVVPSQSASQSAYQPPAGPVSPPYKANNTIPYSPSKPTGTGKQCFLTLSDHFILTSSRCIHLRTTKLHWRRQQGFLRSCRSLGCRRSRCRPLSGSHRHCCGKWMAFGTTGPVLHLLVCRLTATCTHRTT